MVSATTGLTRTGAGHGTPELDSVEGLCPGSAQSHFFDASDNSNARTNVPNAQCLALMPHRCWAVQRWHRSRCGRSHADPPSALLLRLHGQ